MDESCEQCGKTLAEGLKERLGGQDKNFCNKDCIKLFKINLEELRLTTEERCKTEIHFLEREIEYKQNQLKGKITETREITKVPGKPSTVLEGYVGGLKPAYIIENEIEKNNQLIKEQKRQIENTKIAREEDASKSG